MGGIGGTVTNKPDPNAKAPMCKICETRHFGVKHNFKRKKVKK